MVYIKRASFKDVPKRPTLAYCSGSIFYFRETFIKTYNEKKIGFSYKKLQLLIYR